MAVKPHNDLTSFLPFFLRYEDACKKTRSPRTPAWNYSTPEFHNLVSRQPPLTAKDAMGIDELAVKRCQSLLSVSDSYVQIHDFLETLSGRYSIDNTYFLITSDHGYNLGHHRLPSNKFLIYEHDLAIPMVFKGPGIAANSTFDFQGTQVDLAPTILGLAGIDKPSSMDGKSVVPLLVKPAATAATMTTATVSAAFETSDASDASASAIPGSVRRHLASVAAVPSRTTSFFEYYSQGQWFTQGRMLDDWSNTYIGVTYRNGSDWYKFGAFDPYGKQSNFTSVYFEEMFDLNADPWELSNVVNDTKLAGLRAKLHAETMRWYACSGDGCM